MPMYEYECEKCGEKKTLIRKIEERDKPIYCDKCGALMKRNFSNLNIDIQFQAPGFYSTRQIDPLLDPEP